MENINVKDLDLNNPIAYGNKEYDQIYSQMFAKFGKNFEDQYYKLMQKANEANTKATSFEAQKLTTDIIDALKRCFNNIAFDTNHFWEVVEK
jgi:hypothetical protein